jgi:ankyrin repeat protein
MSQPLDPAAFLHGDAAARMERDVLLPEVPHWLYRGDTPLHLAAAMLDTAAATALLGAGADPNAVNRRGAAPLHYACDPRPRTGGWDPEAQQRMIELLVARGAAVNAADAGGVTALHRATRARSPRAVATLLEAKADPGVRTKRGTTPLQMSESSAGAGGTAGTVTEQHEIQSLLTARSNPRS